VGTAPDDLAGMGEFGFIAALARRLPQGSGVVLGPGDDAAVVAAPDSRVVVTVDVLVEGVHFRSDWAGPDDIGRRAAAASLADIAAMGARPTALVVGFAAPPSTPTAWALRVGDGLRDEAALVGASVVGGDVTSAAQVVLSVTALGDLEGRAPVTRSGARSGDIVALCGRLGWAAGGLAVLRRGFGSPRVLVEAYRRPEPPYAAGIAAAHAGATAMCDISDGLVADLGHMAQASGVVIDLDRSLVPVGEPLTDVAAAYGKNPIEWVLTGGDDHALVATFAADAKLPEGFVVIGGVRPTQGEPRVLVDGEPWSGPGGHTHFSG